MLGPRLKLQFLALFDPLALEYLRHCITWPFNILFSFDIHYRSHKYSSVFLFFVADCQIHSFVTPSLKTHRILRIHSMEVPLAVSVLYWVTVGKGVLVRSLVI